MDHSNILIISVSLISVVRKHCKDLTLGDIEIRHHSAEQRQCVFLTDQRGRRGQGEEGEIGEAPPNFCSFKTHVKMKIG